LIGEFVLSGVAYHMSGNIKKYVLDQMNSTFSVYNKTGYEASTLAWNVLQTKVNNTCFNFNNENYFTVTY